MFDEVLQTIGREISAKLAFEELKSIHAIDRWFTFPAFAKSAQYAVSRWKEFGLSGAKVERFPADGRSRVGSWIMPYAWDVDDASLTIEEPGELAGEVIARYRETPSSLAMWSGPTPKGGVVADLVWVEDAAGEDALKGRNLKGRILFTSTRPVFAKGRAAAKGAVGILSDFVVHRHGLADENFWMNAFSDDAGGWGLHSGDSRIFGFNISPRKGERLRALLKKHGRLRVRAVVDTRLYRGEIPTATAVIPGRSRREEVLILGHAFEQGAIDNASGCAVMFEAARVLANLIREGRLPKPRRTIRFLIVSECYSTFAYCLKHPERMASTVAALCVDSVAQKQWLCRSGLGIYRPPDSNASFVTAFAQRLAEKIFTQGQADYQWRIVPYTTTDNVVADPMIGPPTVLLSPYPTDFFWHTSGDTIDKIDVEALGKVSWFAATYLYAIANAGAVHALYLAALAWARAKATLSRATAHSLGRCVNERRHLDAESAQILYEAGRGVREIQSVRAGLTLREAHSIARELSEMTRQIEEDGDRDVAELKKILEDCGRSGRRPRQSAKDKEFLARARGLVVTRKHIGTMAYDTIPVAKRKGHADPRWDAGVTAALFWCDGTRTLAEALDLAGKELGRDLTGLVETFEFMAKNGLITLRKVRK